MHKETYNNWLSPKDIIILKIELVALYKMKDSSKISECGV